jgi:hypothetical protein
MRDDIGNTGAPTHLGCTRRSSMKNLKILVAVVAFSAAGMVGCGGDDAATEDTTATTADTATGGETTTETTTETTETTTETATDAPAAV